MRVIVFTSSKQVETGFAPIGRSKDFVLDFRSPDSLKSVMKETGPFALVYTDVTGIEADAQKRLLKYLESADAPTGIIDRNREVQDVADLFRTGFFDYLDKEILKVGIKPARLKRFAEYAGISEDHNLPKASHEADWKLSGTDWKGIRAGQEYTFCFLFVELDLNRNWKTRSGRGLIDDVMETFKDLLSKAFSPFNGKIWMWMDLGGIVLFPFNGKQIDAIRSCIKLVTNRVISSAEDFSYDTLITFRMAMHIGNTVYKSRGQTGTIVSDTINFIFHLGQQYAKAGCFYLTEETLPYIPEGLNGCFKEDGTFTERTIHRMRMPVRIRV